MDILIPLLAITAVLLIPIGGVMLILTTRFAFKPLVESITRALRESGYSPGQNQARQVLELTERVEALSEEVRSLKEAQDFDRKLLASDAEEHGFPRSRTGS